MTDTDRALRRKHTDGSRSGGQPTQSDALRVALERIEAATRNEIRAGDKGYISRYGIHGIAQAALEARGLEIRSKNDD